MEFDPENDPLRERKLYDEKEEAPFVKGISYIVYKPDLAKEYFLDSLQKRLNIGASLSNLVSASLRVDESPCGVCLPLLAFYGKKLSAESLLNLKLNLFAKEKKDAELVETAELMLPYAVTDNKILHLQSVKGTSLFRLQKYRETIQVLLVHNERILEKNLFNRAASLIFANRLIATSYYRLGEYDKAKAVAEKLLKDNGEDAIAKSIIEGTLDKEENLTEILYDDFVINTEEVLDIKYPSFVAEKINLETNIKGNIKKFVKNGEVEGDLKELASVISFYVREYMTKQGPKQKIDSYASLIKITNSARKNYEDAEQFGFTEEKKYRYAANMLEAYGDVTVLDYVDYDVARFFYLSSLNLFVKGKADLSIFDVDLIWNRLISSFYSSGSELKDIVMNMGGRRLNEYRQYVSNKNNGNLHSFLKLLCFLDDEYNEKIKNLFSLMVKNVYDRDILFELLGFKNSGCDVNIDKLFGEWQRYREATLHNRVFWDLEKFKLDAPGKVAELLTLFKGINAEVVWSELDAKYIKEITGVLVRLQNLSVVAEFDKKEETLVDAHKKCEDLIRDISEHPTRFSFCYMCGILEKLKKYLENVINDVYSKSEPALDIQVQSNSCYLHGSTAKIYFSFVNEKNLQNADVKDLVFEPTSSRFAFENTCNFDRIKSGDKADFAQIVRVDEEAVQKGYIEFKVKLKYYYKVAYEAEPAIKTYEESFHLELRDSSKFVKIANPYKSIVQSGAVTNEMFYGREEDIARIVEGLKNGDKLLTHRGLILYGQKRAGKSSILQNLQKQIEEHYGKEAYLFIDIGSVGDITFNNLNVFLGTVYYKFVNTLRRDYRVLYDSILETGLEIPSLRTLNEEMQSPTAGMLINARFGAVFESLENLGRGEKYIPLFLIDEFTYFYQYIKENEKECIKDFPHFWKGFLQNNDVCSIVVGQDNTPVFTHMPEYANDFACMEPIKVSYLAEKGAKELIEKPIRKEDGSSRIDQAATEIIYRLTAGSAFLIVFLCNNLINYMNENSHENVTKLILTQFFENKLLKEYGDWDSLFESLLTDTSKVGEELNRVKHDNEVIVEEIVKHLNEKGVSPVRDIAYDNLSEPTENYRNILITALQERDVLVPSVYENVPAVRIKVDLLRLVYAHKLGLKWEVF